MQAPNASKVFELAASSRLNFSTFSQIFSPGMGIEFNSSMSPQLKPNAMMRSSILHSKDLLKKSTFDDFDPRTSLVRGIPS